jgi:pilus assembly protein Flp/PilA
MHAHVYRLGAAIGGCATAARARLAREEGQALVEYALIIFCIAIVCVGVLTLLGGRVSTVLQNVVNDF